MRDHRRKWVRQKNLTKPGGKLRFVQGRRQRWFEFVAWKVHPSAAADGLGVMLVKTTDFGEDLVQEVPLVSGITTEYKRPWFLDPYDREGILEEARTGEQKKEPGSLDILPRRRNRTKPGLFKEGKEEFQTIRPVTKGYAYAQARMGSARTKRNRD